MGYGSYELASGPHAGEWGGYGIEAVCDADGCKTQIDRGLAHLCGRHPGGGDDGCGGYFCDDHLFLTGTVGRGFVCGACSEHDEGQPDA